MSQSISDKNNNVSTRLRSKVVYISSNKKNMLANKCNIKNINDYKSISKEINSFIESNLSLNCVEKLNKCDNNSVDDKNIKDNILEYHMPSFESITDNNNDSDINSNMLSSNTTKDTPYVKFTENSFLVDLGVSYSKTEDSINTNNPYNSYMFEIDFKKYLSTFEEDKINDFEIQDIINFDFEDIALVKDKLNDLIDKSSLLVNFHCDKETLNETNNNNNNYLLIDEYKDRANDVLSFLCNKLNEIKTNEKQIKVVINNIDKVKSIGFVEDRIIVNFY